MHDAGASEVLISEWYRSLHQSKVRIRSSSTSSCLMAFGCRKEHLTAPKQASCGEEHLDHQDHGQMPSLGSDSLKSTTLAEGSEGQTLADLQGSISLAGGADLENLENLECSHVNRNVSDSQKGEHPPLQLINS